MERSPADANVYRQNKRDTENAERTTLRKDSGGEEEGGVENLASFAFFIKLTWVF